MPIKDSLPSGIDLSKEKLRIRVFCLLRKNNHGRYYVVLLETWLKLFFILGFLPQFFQVLSLCCSNNNPLKQRACQQKGSLNSRSCCFCHQGCAPRCSGSLLPCCKLFFANAPAHPPLDHY